MVTKGLWMVVCGFTTISLANEVPVDHIRKDPEAWGFLQHLLEFSSFILFSL